MWLDLLNQLLQPASMVLDNGVPHATVSDRREKDLDKKVGHVGRLKMSPIFGVGSTNHHSPLLQLWFRHEDLALLHLC